MKEIFFTKEQQLEICELFKVTTTRNIGKKFNCSKQTIVRVLKQNNINTYKTNRQYKINQNYFNKIDSNDKAYWLGLLTADGSVTLKESIVLSLQKNDKYLIELFVKYLDSNYLIKDSISKNKSGSISYMSTLHMTSKIMVKDLRDLGLNNNKTLKEIYPNINDVYFKHYLRGLIDGDGGFCLKDNGKKISFYFCATPEFIEIIQNKLIQFTGVNKTKIQNTKTSYLKVISYGGFKNVYKICKFIYNDKSDLYMKRKYDICYNYFKNKNFDLF